MMPRAIVFSPFQMMERRYLVAAQKAGMELHAAPDLQDWSSQLFRDEDAIGILWAKGSASAAETIRRMRQGNVLNRVIVLLDYVSDAPHRKADARADALIAGADDAQDAAIDVDELAARLKVLAERIGYVDHLKLEFCGCTYVEGRGIVGPNGTVHVSPIQGDLLVALARFPGQTRSKAKLYDALYDFDDGPETKVLDVLLCKLRHAIMKATGGRDCIRTDWGKGLIWIPEGFIPEVFVSRRHARPQRRFEASA